MSDEKTCRLVPTVFGSLPSNLPYVRESDFHYKRVLTPDHADAAKALTVYAVVAAEPDLSPDLARRVLALLDALKYSTVFIHTEDKAELATVMAELQGYTELPKSPRMTATEKLAVLREYELALHSEGLRLDDPVAALRLVRELEEDIANG